MQKTTRKAVKIALWGAAVGLAVAAGVVFRLASIDEPEEAASLEFRGFVLLPGASTLNVLDYLTISDQSLFVTNESTGAVYRVALKAEGLPEVADVSVFASEPAAHGVVLNSAKTVAYVTRSEA